MRKIFIMGLQWLVLSMACVTPLEAHAATPIYSIAVIPTAPPTTLNTLWTPFAKRLSRETGVEFHLKLYDKMADFERDIWNGVPDFIFSSPIQVVVAHRTNGYIPLVRGSRKVSIGLYVRHDSPIRSMDDLANKKIAFVGNKNLCSVAIRNLLDHHGVRLSFTSNYAGSTRNVIISVLLGKSDAGALFLPELEREPEETRRQLRELLATPEIAPHPLSVHPRVPPALQESVRKGALRIAATGAGAELLKGVMLQAPIAAVYSRDYQALEQIDIIGLTNWGR